MVEVGPTQFKVAVDDMIVTERLRGADVNQTVALNRVLMLGDQDETRIGRPLVPDARVIAAVEASSMLVATRHFSPLCLSQYWRSGLAMLPSSVDAAPRRECSQRLLCDLELKCAYHGRRSNFWMGRC